MVSLKKAKLQYADLSEADLAGADLSMADLRFANLSGTRFRDCVLWHADLRGATNLWPRQFAGSDLTGSRLTEPLDQSVEMHVIEEASKVADRLFVLMMAACAYAWLTIGTTLDTELLTDAGTSNLPIISVPLPTGAFYWVAPVLLLAFQLYFNFFAQRLSECLADCPAIFPDGSVLHRKIYPSLLGGLAQLRFRHLRNKCGWQFCLVEAPLSIFLLWWVVPSTIAFIWLRYLPRHDWAGTTFHIFLLLLAVFSAHAFSQQARTTLAGQCPGPSRWKRTLLSTTIYQRSAWAMLAVATLAVISFGAVNGVPPASPWPRKMNATMSPTDIRRLVPQIMSVLHFSPFADFAERDVSRRKPSEDRTGNTKADAGARLHSRDLRYVNGFRAFLVDADMRSANLEGAMLKEANLQGARLDGANLQGSNLFGADLSRARLVSARLDGGELRLAKLKAADLRWAKLTGADLGMATLEDANLFNARLSDVDLYATDLEGADLREAEGLTLIQIQSAKNWERAFYSEWALRMLGLPTDHNESLAKARLRK
jgi:uncharacterized protein YjbI with pentapeptide repeats